MSVRETAEKHKSLLSRIEEAIIPLQEQKLWNDDKFFKEVNKMLMCGKFNEGRIASIVARALFDIKISQPDIEVVKKLIKAFPGALNCKDRRGTSDCIPIQMLLVYYIKENKKSDEEMGCFGTSYLSALALEGMKHNVGGANMRGGLLNNVHELPKELRCLGKINTFQYLVLGTHGDNDNDLNALKDLRRNGLLLREDIVNQSLLFYSSFNVKSGKKTEYMVSWDPAALCTTRVNNSPLLHAIINYKEPELGKVGFVHSVYYSFKYKRNILFQKDNDDKTAFKLALEKFGEEWTMYWLKLIFKNVSGPSLLHNALLHEPQFLNLFLKYFADLYHLRDEEGRTLTQVMLSKKRDYLEENAMLWMNLSTDQLEEKDPHTTLRPFAAVASGDDANLDLSFRILRKHPSIMEVILEQREKMAIKMKNKKRKAQVGFEECRKKKIREAAETTA
ncbi:hypothetical protein CTEN210_13282 [Chaetoceros tenuissimus]|uniref:Uncharacterized protein n=1 Tax=Chaetoceros tenuissimus TaxID=426638 RepID=A0AAD3HB30_9STRA|nr:hypothetical protein CTEN210_13282 [Chaetoceros tenuissimus]